MFPQLQSNDYWLQEILPDDLPFIFKGLSDPEVTVFYGVHYNSLEATRAQLDFYQQIRNERTGCWWKIVEQVSGIPVGAAGMNDYSAQHEKAEIGFWLLPEYQGRGIMREVIPVMIRQLFDSWPLHRLEAVIEEGNTASCRLAEKLGFQLEGRHRDAEIKNGKRITLLFYSLLKTDL